jgi:hypothetical protein
VLGTHCAPSAAHESTAAFGSQKWIDVPLPVSHVGEQRTL